MCGRVAFLAVLVWFFSAESRSDAFTSKITRGYLDSFTNGVCGPCSKYEATPSTNSSGSCTCNGSTPCFTDIHGAPQGSVFVRSKGKCESSCTLTNSNKCFYWEHRKPMAVLDLQDLNYAHEFLKENEYPSCKWGQRIAYLDASGNWQQVNLPANAFQVVPLNGLQRYQRVKVNQRSASLTKLSGQIMKLGLNCTKRGSNEIIPKCLIFKSKGKLNFSPCDYTINTTTSSPPPSSAITTVISTGTPAMIIPLALLAVCLTLGV